MTIKIKADALKDFFVKATADGLVTDAKLEFLATGLQMRHKDPAGIIYVAAFLSKTEFLDYSSPETTLEIPDTGVLLQVLKTFGDATIQINREGNMAKIQSEDSSFDLTLGEKIECFKSGDIPKLEYTHSIICKKSMMDNIIKAAKIVKTDSIQALNKEKQFSFSIGKESNKAKVTCPTAIDEELKTLFDRNYFERVYNALGLLFDLSIGGEMPSRFTEKSDKHNLLIYMSPISSMSE